MAFPQLPVPGIAELAGVAGAAKARLLVAGAASLAMAQDVVTQNPTETAERVMAAGAAAFGVAAGAIAEHTPEIVKEAANWTVHNPAVAASGAVSAVGLVVVAAPALATLPILSAVGFGAGGVQAGSMAAGAHAALGNVAVGSGFSVAQSAAAGGAGLATVNGIGQVVGGAVAAGSAATAWLKSKL